MSTTTSTAAAPMNRHQRRAQAAIARRAAAEKAAQQAEACHANDEEATQHADDAHVATDDNDHADTQNHGPTNGLHQNNNNNNGKAARQEARKAAFRAAMCRALRAMMTEYSQERYGAWWITGLDRILRNRLHDGYGTVEPDLLALGIIRDAAAGWWRWPENAPEPVFHADTKFTRVVPRKPVPRGRPRPAAPAAGAATADNAAEDTGKEQRQKAVSAAREAEAAAFKSALRQALRALMTDYCQERFDGAWWYTDLADTLAHRLRAGEGRFDADLAHINVLRNSCRGWWVWVDGTTGPAFVEDAPRAPRAAKRPSPEGAQPRPMPAETTRRKHARAQHKQRPAGAVARGRPAT